MYCTLTDPKFFRRLSYCRFCFYYVMCNLHCTFFDIILQRKIPRRHRFYSVCGGFMWYVLLIYLLEEHRNNINSKCNDRRNNCGNLPDIVFFVHLCFFFQRWLLENTDFFLNCRDLVLMFSGKDCPVNDCCYGYYSRGSKCYSVCEDQHEDIHNDREPAAEFSTRSYIWSVHIRIIFLQSHICKTSNDVAKCQGN